METHWIVLLSVVGWLLCGYLAACVEKRLEWEDNTNARGIVTLCSGGIGLGFFAFYAICVGIEKISDKYKSSNWKAWLDKEAKWIL